MAPRNSGIPSVADLAGKRIGIGPQGGTSGLYMPQVFKTLKLDAIFQTGSWADLTAQVRAGSLDALAVAAGVPVPSFAELERGRKVRYVALAQDQMVALRLAMPELAPSVVAAGTYPSLLRHYQTVGMFNFAVARRACRAIWSTRSSRRYSPTTRNSWGSTRLQRRPFRPISRATRFCRFIRGHPTGTAARPPQASCAETEGLRDAENREGGPRKTDRARVQSRIGRTTIGMSRR